MPEANQNEMTLAHAARELRQTWAKTYDQILSGVLEGRQIGTRWWVTTESVQRLARSRELETSAA